MSRATRSCPLLSVNLPLSRDSARTHTHTGRHSGKESWNVGKMPIITWLETHTHTHAQNSQMTHYIREVCSPPWTAREERSLPASSCVPNTFDFLEGSCAVLQHEDVGGKRGKWRRSETLQHLHTAGKHCRRARELRLLEKPLNRWEKLHTRHTQKKNQKIN